MAGAVNPGFVVRLTQKGLDYARQEGMTILRQELTRVNIPDYSGSTRSPVGKIKYNLYGSFRGGFNLKVNGITISVTLKLGKDGAVRPTIVPTDCTCHTSDVNVHVSGKFGWLINLFKGRIEKELKSTIEKQICPLVNKAIANKLVPLLQTLPVTSKIDKVAAIDYSLIGPPPVTTKYVDVPLKGEFFELPHHTPPPFSPPSLSLPGDHNLMIYFGFSDYLFRTAGYVYHSAGKLIYNVTDNMIPKDFDVRLKTSSYN
ncbi:bactericidal permeability-increasing protein-like [Pyxicephalus adspersus]|uniref:bactericidal permeability-increasing protein-like n=1 Tax=Pyxicephalus adspersus TaxID=30357 RepID=UPI003B5BF929